VVYRAVCTEGSETAKSGTDEQKRNTGALLFGQVTGHCDAPRQQKDRDNQVASAVIGGRENLLPGEVLKDTCIRVKKSAEVIVAAGNEPPT
jgi:hypothetical protein